MSTTVRSARINKKQKEMEYEEKLKVLDEELMSFYQYCQQVGFTESEMDVICAPLVSSLRKSAIKKIVKCVAIVALVLGIVYGISHLGAVSLHFYAITRLFMIKLLPFWDWTSMFYESCLVSNPFYGEYTLTEEDCISCEALEYVDRLGNVAYEQLLDGYLSRDAPLIVIDAMESWPVMNTDDFWFDNITQLYLQDDKLVDTVPCILTTNLRPGSSDLHAFLKRISSPQADKWFVHWQNCDINAVKALRKFYQRPYFLSSSVSPAHFNWVLMSSDYNTRIYKKLLKLVAFDRWELEKCQVKSPVKLLENDMTMNLICLLIVSDALIKVELDSGLIMLAQLRGTTSFRLTPHNPCNSSCPELLGDLQEGEVLVFTNFMWTFEYYPGRNLDNVAILTETVWEEGSN